MAVSAIHPAGLQPAASPQAKSHRSAIPMPNFAAMLAAFDGLDASDGALPAPTISAVPEQQPAFGTIAFRSSTLAGHVRLTTIAYSDGTSETRLDELGADMFVAPLPRPTNLATPRFDTRAFSDPEIDNRVWRARRKIIGERGRGTDVGMSDGSSPAAAPRRLASITSDTPGRVIDLFA